MELRAGLVALGIAVTSLGCARRKAPPPPHPPKVTVTPVLRQDVPLYVESVGSLDGYVNVDIRARVPGFLRAQNYGDGTPVKANQLLFTIEKAEFVAALDAARGQLERARALQTFANTELERSKHLFATGSVSPQDVDNHVASLKDAAGQVEAAEAGLRQAELNLSYTDVRSPIDGLAGIALVRIGNLVGKGDPTLLTTVSQIDPVRANFTMSEIDYVRYPERLKHFEGRTLAWAKAQFPKLDSGIAAEGEDPGVELIVADGSVYPHRGVIVTANRQVDPQTGTIQLQALFPNHDAVLRPGQFGRVRTRRINEGQAALVVPEKSIISVQGTYSVGIIGAESKVELRRVELGPSARGLRIVDSGVREGERVVVEGVQGLRQGAHVDAEPASPVSLTSGGVEAAPSARPGAPDGGAP